MAQADLVAKVGVSRLTIHSIEKGGFIPSTLLSLKMAKVFDQYVENIFQLEEIDWN
tara:strand:- start:222 stop:389 length:168 start_codon:yes stop_codon:yes gene_type:complete